MSFPPPRLEMSAKGKHDMNGHPMALWDAHPASRSCMAAVGRVCSQSTPCPVCRLWTKAQWQYWDAQEAKALLKRQKRAEAAQAKLGRLASEPVNIPLESSARSRHHGSERESHSSASGGALVARSRSGSRDRSGGSAQAGRAPFHTATRDWDSLRMPPPVASQ